jgi:hypothetical protein
MDSEMLGTAPVRQKIKSDRRKCHETALVAASRTSQANHKNISGRLTRPACGLRLAYAGRGTLQSGSTLRRSNGVQRQDRDVACKKNEDDESSHVFSE